MTRKARAGKGMAQEAKAIVALAFRNGPIEDVHAGKTCPACHGKAGYSRITQDEMKAIMKSAVNKVYKLLALRDEHRAAYDMQIKLGSMFASDWDEPEAL